MTRYREELFTRSGARVGAVGRIVFRGRGREAAPAATGWPGLPSLTVMHRGQRLAVRGPLVVGRSQSCHLQIDDLGVARRHVEIYSVGDLWWIRDLGSDGGTYLEGEMIEAAPLSAGPAQLRLGTNGPTLSLDIGRGSAP